MTISELVERATSFGGTGNANRASTLPYDVVYIDHTVLAAVHLSEVVGSILISIGTATIAGNHLASNLQRSSTEHLSPARIGKLLQWEPRVTLADGLAATPSYSIRYQAYRHDDLPVRR
jgi:nucleoside-diphosphate-sugar epimerase